ncbi:MAG: response regulator [Bryobacteraceae bacterium]
MKTRKDIVPARILLIEDNAGDITLFRYALDATGEPYELQVLEDGGEALNYVRDHWTSLPSYEPCVIVLDLRLPKCDGIEILEKLRQAPALSHVKVAVVTAGASPADEARIAHLNVGLFGEKSTSIDEFLDLGKDIMRLCQGKLSDVAA